MSEVCLISSSEKNHIEIETSGEKAKLELHKVTTCYFQQIFEAAAFKTAVIQPLISHLTNHPSKTNNKC